MHHTQIVPPVAAACLKFDHVIGVHRALFKGQRNAPVM
jgi:hypothetical protein